jgi:hypothetical protein
VTNSLTPTDRPRFERRPADFTGYVTARNGKLVDGTGHPLLLRGVGLGNWMLPEGYMWRFGPGAQSPRQIESLVTRLLGEDAAQRFWEQFRVSFISESDIRAIAASGFDHVRLPINARVIQDSDGSPIEAGYAMIDRLIDWCRAHHLWVLLDLHGAPGGQTGTNIDDSPHGLPELFMSDEYRTRTIQLWEELARRYASETVVLGYDLLNEPLPNEWQYRYAGELATLYKDLTVAIRMHDPDHLIMYEGVHWATNWDIFTDVWDENSCLQFHKYWSSPDVGSIAPFLEARDRLGLPIYMGEGGENTLEWIYAAFRLYETHDIGWCFWPWKKIATVTSPVSIVPPAGWEKVVASIDDQDAISRTEAQRVFDDLLDAMRVENCVQQPNVVSALLAERPVVLPSWGFGYRGAGESHGTSVSPTISGIRDDDGVAISWRQPGDNPANPFEQPDGRPYHPAEELVVELDIGDWLEFEVATAVDVARTRVLDRAGLDAPVRVHTSKRGLRVVAMARTAISHVIPGDQG